MNFMNEADLPLKFMESVWEAEDLDVHLSSALLLVLMIERQPSVANKRH